MRIKNLKKNWVLKLSFLSLFASIIFLSSCLEQINLDIPKGTEETIVIQGVLIKGNPSVLDLTVSRLFDFTVEGLSRINVSLVELSDEAGNSIEIDARGTGIYYREFFDNDPDINIEIGKSYKIKVRTFDGRVYESTLEPMLDVPKINDFQAKKVTKELITPDEEIVIDSFIEFSIDTDLRAAGQTENTNIKWDIQRVFRITDFPIEFGKDPKTCYVTNNLDITQLKVLGSQDIDATNLMDYTVFDEQLNFYFAEGYYGVIIQQSLSPRAFTYFNQISQILTRDGNMLEPPAGKVRSNFTNMDDPTDEAFGFFYATVHDTARVFVSVDFAGFQNNLCPPNVPSPPGGGCPLDICCDCLSADISTVTQPDWWEE